MTRANHTDSRHNKLYLTDKEILWLNSILNIMKFSKWGAKGKGQDYYFIRVLQKKFKEALKLKGYDLK